MKISNEVLGCLGALFLLILSVLLGGLIVWGLGNLIIWCFNLDLTFKFWQGLVIWFVLATIKVCLVGGSK